MIKPFPADRPSYVDILERIKTRYYHYFNCIKLTLTTS